MTTDDDRVRGNFAARMALFKANRDDDLPPATVSLAELFPELIVPPEEVAAVWTLQLGLPEAVTKPAPKITCEARSVDPNFAGAKGAPAPTTAGWMCPVRRGD